MPDTVTYGDIQPRTAAYAAAELLRRGQPILITERFGQARPLPAKKTKVIKFRRYESLSAATTPLAEGVTPSGQRLTYTDVECTLEQFGDYVEITDVVKDTHEDPVLQEAVSLCGEQAAETLELVRIAVLKAGTTVFFANGTARNQVTGFTNRGQLRKVVRYLKSQKAKFFTQIVKATPAFATEPVGPCFWAMGHTDLEADIRSLAGFVPIELYADSDKAIEGEVGKVENIRFVLTPLFSAWEDAGGNSDGTQISTGGSKCDVYPLIIAARDAYAVVPLKGENAVAPRVINPEQPSKSDPLGQRGYVSWKTYHSSVILNDNWLARIEVTATLNPS